MENKNHIDDDKLDKLLKDLSLQEEQGSMDDMAQFVMSQEYHAKPDPAKEQQLISDLDRQFGRRPKYTWFLSGAIFMLGLAGLLFYLFHTSSPGPVTKNAVKPAFPSEDTSVASSGETTVLRAERESDKQVAVVKDAFGHDVPQLAVQTTDSVHPELAVPVSAAAKRSTQPHIPVLTTEEKTRYSRVKRMMLEKLIGLDKSLYTKVPADKMQYAGKTEILEPFTIRNFSISNLEYKTFLADLLMQNRTDDYLLAQVHPENWKQYGAPELANTYLQDDRYNDFPVVNISYEGARVFCRWIEEEARQYMEVLHIKNKPLQIRLPNDKEWVYIAWAGYSKIPYEAGSYTTVFDASEGLVDKGFSKRIEQIKKHARQKDSLYDLLAVNKYGWTENEIEAFMSRAFRYMNPLPADTIQPARMKIYMKVGSVSEITMGQKPGQIWLSGKCWKSREEYNTMKEAFMKTGSSPFAGFRIVVINSNDSEYKDPFW